ncbi:hypothetical protein BH10ACT11_BH10ACT11_22140 [soil metagenome]
MALSADQTAMLELLVDGGQGYDELADLFSLDESEVRLRARTALAALGGSDPDRRAPLSDYLLGQADPIDRADAVRHLKEDPDDHALAQRILTCLAEIAPGATLVKLPDPSGGRFMRKSPATPGAVSSSGSAAAPASSSSSSLTSQQKRLIAILGSGAVILIAIVLAVTGAFSGGDDSSTGTSGTNSTASNTDLANGTDANGNETATVPLKAPGNGKAKGQAVIGVASGDQAYVDISLAGLDPAPKGSAYVIWMLLAKNQGYPLAPIQTTKKGTYQNRFPVSAQVLPVVARVQDVNISLAKISDIEQEIKDAAKKGSPIINRIGDTVLEGAIPRSAQTAQPPAGSGATSTSTTTKGSTTAPDATTTAPDTTSTTDSTTGGG